MIGARPDRGSTMGDTHVAVDGRYLSKPGIGIHGYTLGIVDLLLELGVRVTVLTNVAPRCQLPPEVDVRTFGSERNIVWDQVDLPRHFARHRYDVYWAPANNGIPLVGPRPPLSIMTIHDLIPWLQPVEHIIRRPLYGLPWVVCVVVGAVRADVITTVSEYSARRIATWLRRRALVIPPTSVQQTVSSTSPAPTHPELRGPYVLYNGGFGSRKRVDTLLRAMASLPASNPAQLVCLGRHMGQYGPLIDELGVRHRVIAPGYVSEEERDAWVGHAHALAYPSTMEGFGLPLLEAMSRGVPVVTSPNSSLREVGGDAALYAAADDPGQWAEAFERLDDEKVREQCRERGLARAEEYRRTDLAGLVEAAVVGAGDGRPPSRRRAT